MKYSILIILIGFAFLSCVSSKKMIRLSDEKILQISPKDINGVYKNTSDSLNQKGLWEVLNSSITLKHEKLKAPENSNVKITVLTEKRLKIDLVTNGKCIDSIMLNGEFKNGFFSIKRKLFFIYTPIFGTHSEKKTVVAVNNRDELLVLYGREYHGWVLIGGKSNSERLMLRYRQIEN